MKTVVRSVQNIMERFMISANERWNFLLIIQIVKDILSL
nr:MAG TPA: hypothetical protein [Caudoviricetes sp.]